MTRPLDGLLVIALEQAVAAPFCTMRLADAGARVIKVERPEGDFARFYDAVALGQSSYFVWLNRGKESIALDLSLAADKVVLEAMLARADVLVQNLKPGALERLGFEPARLRADYPRLIIVSVSGYGRSGPSAERKAYDLLIQAESGLAAVTGGPEAPARIGVSAVDIGTGMNANEAVLEALILRGRTGQGSVVDVSMFDAMSEWMTVPLLQHEGGKTPRRIGLAHPSISPYGVFRTRDGVDILISIQSEREWAALATSVLNNPGLVSNPRFATNVARVAHRAETDGLVAAVFGAMESEAVVDLLMASDIAFGRVSDLAGLAAHPHLRRVDVVTPAGTVSVPAPPALWQGSERSAGAVPAIGQHSVMIRAEFTPGAPPQEL